MFRFSARIDDSMLLVAILRKTCRLMTGFEVVMNCSIIIQSIIQLNSIKKSVKLNINLMQPAINKYTFITNDIVFVVSLFSTKVDNFKIFNLCYTNCKTVIKYFFRVIART